MMETPASRPTSAKVAARGEPFFLEVIMKIRARFPSGKAARQSAAFQHFNEDETLRI